ncbi:MAG: stage II sporulation protein E (SpoIIE) [Deltaproteobacteria bacterium]|nr:MAG: stage II sporulation protein E (SpoIIE) [Deltaproteobacteria bacterium]
MEAVSTRLIEWGVAELALGGQVENGDCCVVQPFAGGVLLAAVDGLGHGHEAAAAARIAAATLGQFASEPLAALFYRCHEGLRHTRGVVMSLASFHAGEPTMAWCGVGSVAGVLQRVGPFGSPASDTLLLRSGVVGSHLPPLRASTYAVNPGDTLILATDGIRPGFAEELLPLVPPQPAADRILSRYARGTDDALVLVARYRGGTA